MDVAKLSHEARMVPYIVIEAARLPERRPARHAPSLPSHRKGNLRLQQLNRPRMPAIVGLTQQEVNMFRHDNIAEDPRLEPSPRLLKSKKERLFHVHLRQQGKTVITTECNEMRLTGTREPFETFRHDVS